MQDIESSEKNRKINFPNYQDVLISSGGYTENQCYLEGILFPAFKNNLNLKITYHREN